MIESTYKITRQLHEVAPGVLVRAIADFVDLDEGRAFRVKRGDVVLRAFECAVNLSSSSAAAGPVFVRGSAVPTPIGYLLVEVLPKNFEAKLVQE